MAFAIRKYEKKGATYIAIVENYRDPSTGKSRTTSVKSYGNLSKLLLNDPDIETKIQQELDELKQNEAKRLEAQQIRALGMRINEIEVSTAYNRTVLFGEVILRRQWEQLELHKLFSRIRTEKKIPFCVDSAAYCMVAARLASPGSKKKCYLNSRSGLFDYSDLSLDDFYDSLDTLAAQKERIISFVNQHIEKLYQRDLSIALYDVTTFYFEAFNEDEIRDHGLSKDRKVAQTQVVLGMMIDTDGVPVDYKLFKGNTHEIGTMLQVLNGYLTQYHIQNVTVVADCGLNCKDNLLKLSEQKHKFIVTQSLRKLSKSLLNEILSKPATAWSFKPGDYDKWRMLEVEHVISGVKKDDEGECVKDAHGKPIHAELKVRLIVNFSAKRYAKDMDDINKLEEKARKYLAKGDRVIEEGKARRYEFVTKFGIDENGKSTGKPPARNSKNYVYGLNTKLIEERKRVAGYYAFITNDYQADNAQLYTNLRSLWKIEQCFRVMKTFLEARPVYVRTLKHIQGHFVMCYLALVIERLCVKTLKEKFDPAFSTDELVKFLNGPRLGQILTVRRAPQMLSKLIGSEYDTSDPALLQQVGARLDQVMECFGVKALYNCEAAQSIAAKFKVSIKLNPILTIPKSPAKV